MRTASDYPDRHASPCCPAFPCAMSQKILITRLVGLGDVASILIPAVGLIRAAHPESRIDVLTYQAGIELMSLHGGVGDVLGISEEQWPRDVIPATQSFL